MALRRFQGWVEQGGHNLTVLAGITAEDAQRSYPSSTVTVYLAGTLTLATIYSDSSYTAQANPFTASTSGYWAFYAEDGKLYDVTFSGGDISVPYTLGDMQGVGGFGGVGRDAIGGIHVESYGARGDGTTDDTSAIQDAADAAKSAGSWLIFTPGSDYLVTDTLDFGQTAPGSVYVRGVMGYGASITGAVAGQPVVDWTGAHGPSKFWQGLKLIGDDTDMPSVGLLLGRSTSGAGSSIAYVQQMITSGSFSVSAVYNACSETTRWVHCYFVNEDGISPFILTQTNSRGVTSPNYTLQSGESSTLQWFKSCTFNYQDAAPPAKSSAFEIESFSNVFLDNCQLNTTNDTTLLRIIHDSANGGQQPDNIGFRNGSFHSGYDIGTYFEGTLNRIYIENNRYGNPGATTAFMKAAASTTIRNSRLEGVGLLDFSAANVDFVGTDVNLPSTAGGNTLSVARLFSGNIRCRSDDTITLSGNINQRIGKKFLVDKGTVVQIGNTIQTFTADDATPSVALGNEFITANTSCTITDFDDGQPGQTIRVLFGDGNTTVAFNASASLKGNGNADWSPTSGDILYGTLDTSGVWRCIVGAAT